MENIDLLNIIIGGAIGATLGILFPKWLNTYSSWRKSKRLNDRRIFLRANDKIDRWVENYYKQNGNDSILFDCKIGVFEKKIPFITKEEWTVNKKICLQNNELLDYSETIEQGFKVDKRILEKRRDFGQKIFNDPTLYIDRIEVSRDSIKLHVKDCDYYNVATSLINFEEETYSAIKKKTSHYLPIRDKYFPNVSKIEKLLLKPFSMGCSVALALKTDASYELIIHTRSHSTICAGGLKTVIPNFGLVPIFGGIKKLALKKETRQKLTSGPNHNLIYYNFIKEYLEELFDYEDLIKSIDSNKANPFWFYDLPEARFVSELINNNIFICEFLGFGFEAVNGTAMIALLGIINDKQSSSDLKNSLKLNWEVSRKKGMIEIDFIDIDSPELEILLKHSAFTASGAFAISRAIKVLKKSY
jgi:hypothetical protein